jgi:type I restriction enzyme M protein
LVLEKRHTNADSRPDVFCAVASSIGESLDARRISIPSENTLQDIAEAFVEWEKNSLIPPEISKRIKIINSGEFLATNRWDILRFWDDEEQVAIGERDESIETIDFITEIKIELQELLTELTMVEEKLKSLISAPTSVIDLQNTDYFNIRRGKRVTRRDCDMNPGTIPIYSGSKFKMRPLGKTSEEFAKKNGLKIENSEENDKPIITINANGAVGFCFVRREKCIIHDDVMIVEVLSDKLYLDYVEIALQKVINAGNFEYEAKLYNRVKDLKIEVPMNEAGEIDLPKQEEIANTQKHLETVSQRIAEVGKYVNKARLR